MRETASRGPYKAVCARRESTGPATRPITGRLPAQGTRRGNKQRAGQGGIHVCNGGWVRRRALVRLGTHADSCCLHGTQRSCWADRILSPSDTAAAVPKWPVDQILVPGTSRRRSGDLFQEPLRVAWIDLSTGAPPPCRNGPERQLWRGFSDATGVWAPQSGKAPARTQISLGGSLGGSGLSGSREPMTAGPVQFNDSNSLFELCVS
ncbi:hypothetical protein BT67DRAFT_28885 [Trichocladium antarcticum]|uniref:Uncharacterized protein n=1 Tax=Trichocladium antarcticum TaxID=1450529 RepID=A0AAN6UTI4_9PEZI|nr:hypothetical protein BT67DRAFT_28885 [Trichocladium antarcticum]